MKSHNIHSRGGLEFTSKELFDLGVAWIALSIAFAIFLGRPGGLAGDPLFALQLSLVSALTVGVGFILHELAHKVAAVRFGQVAHFQASYGMLGVAILSAIVGFIFAAPGAVAHRGRITKEEHGKIALAGPATNLALVVAFLPLYLLLGPIPFLWQVGAFGVLVNAFLAAFNMIPYGPLDGKTVYEWHTGVFTIMFLGSVLLTIVLFLAIGFPL